MTIRPDTAEVEITSVADTVYDDREFSLVTLTEIGGKRRLSIIIGRTEGLAIARALAGSPPPRPMTHDLLAAAVEGLGARLTQVSISQGDADNFTAIATLSSADGSQRNLDCRPSDALALAARTEPRPLLEVESSLLQAPPGSR